MKIENRGDRRDLNMRKYVSNLKKNLYWLILDDASRFPLSQHENWKPKNWKEADKKCKFAKLLKNGGNYERISGYDKWERAINKAKKHKDRTEWKEDAVNEAMSFLGHLINFENYCSACDNFDTDECPYKGRVDYDTDWRVIRCNNFLD